MEEGGGGGCEGGQKQLSERSERSYLYKIIMVYKKYQSTV